MPPKAAPKHPCLACGQNVTSNSIACSVCNRWTHLACSGIDQAVLKFFQAQQEDAGTHSWSCKGCNIAYVALNSRIRQVERRQQALEETVKNLEAGQDKTNDRVTYIEESVKKIDDRTRLNKEDIIAAATKQMSMEQREREARKSNVVLYGISEPPLNIKDGNKRQGIDKSTVGDMFDAIGAQITEDDVKFSARIGKMTEAITSKPRPLKLSFRNQKAREHLFDRARNLPKTSFKDVSISPDLTDQQRKEDKELMDETNKLNDENDDLNFIYRCIGRRGERTIIKTKNHDNHQHSQTRATRHNTSAAATRLHQPLPLRPVVPQPGGPSTQKDHDQPRQNADHDLAETEEDNNVEKRPWESSEEDPDNENRPSPRRPSQAKKTRSQKTP